MWAPLPTRLPEPGFPVLVRPEPELPASLTNVTQSPFGLPTSISMTEYLADPALSLSKYNYKVEASIGPKFSCRTSRLTVFDTSAGPNLVRANVLPEEVLRNLDKSREIVNLTSASKHRLTTLGLVRLCVQVGAYVTMQTFIVVRELAADVILGCSFIDSHVEEIKIRKRTVVLSHGSTVPILRRRDGVPRMFSPKQDLSVPAPPPEDRILRMSRTTVLPSESESWVYVLSEKTGVQFFEPNAELLDKQWISLSPGIVEVKKNVPFKVKVANFSEKPRRLSRLQKIGYVLPAPEETAVYAVDFDADVPSTVQDKKLSESEKKEWPEVEGEGLATALSPEKAPDGVRQATDAPSVEDVELEHLPNSARRKVREMLRPLSDMWSGKLGTLGVTEHRITLKEGAKPVYSQPYRAGPKSREVEHREVDKMLEKKVIEPSQSEWASPVVIIPKPDGSLRFCVDYRKLNSLTVKDSYPLPRMDECLDSLGEANFFTALDCNAGY